MKMRHIVLGILGACVVGYSLSWVINDHFENYEKKCALVLYEAGRKTSTTEVPCP